MIIGLIDTTLVEIFYLDYGTKSQISIGFCRFLAKRFYEPKAQAINVKLGGLKPPKKHFWPPKSISRFQFMAFETNKYEEQGCVMTIMEKKAKQKPEIIIFDTVR